MPEAGLPPGICDRGELTTLIVLLYVVGVPNNMCDHYKHLAQEQVPTGPPSLPSLLKHVSQPLGVEDNQDAAQFVGGPLRAEASLPEADEDTSLLGSAAAAGAAGLPVALTGGSSAEVWERLKALRTFYTTASSEGARRSLP